MNDDMQVAEDASWVCSMHPFSGMRSCAQPEDTTIVNAFAGTSMPVLPANHCGCICLTYLVCHSACDCICLTYLVWLSACECICFTYLVCHSACICVCLIKACSLPAARLSSMPINPVSIFAQCLSACMGKCSLHLSSCRCTPAHCAFQPSDCICPLCLSTFDCICHYIYLTIRPILLGAPINLVTLTTHCILQPHDYICSLLLCQGCECICPSCLSIL
jgi:hypothetical protein